jgi:hypothetical protein
MSGCAHEVTFVQGSCVLPDKEFRSSPPHVAMGLGPSLRLSVGTEPAGVWPLRIPGTELFSRFSAGAFAPAIRHSCSTSWPFLLIARTGWIVTGPNGPSTTGFSGVPANSQLHSTRHRIEGQRPGTSGHSTLGPL